MRTKSILKIAVVATAALAAYAFNGNSQQPTFIHDGSQCMNIDYACDYNGVFDCLITTNKGDVLPAWLDTECLIVAKHSSKDPVKRKDLNL